MNRPRDYAYEALAEVSGLDWEVDRGRLNAALREIREREPDIESYPLADLIYERAKLYVEMWPDGGLTPTAVASTGTRCRGWSSRRRSRW